MDQSTHISHICTSPFHCKHPIESVTDTHVQNVQMAMEHTIKVCIAHIRLSFQDPCMSGCWGCSRNRCHCKVVQWLAQSDNGNCHNHILLERVQNKFVLHSHRVPCHTHKPCQKSVLHPTVLKRERGNSEITKRETSANHTLEPRRHLQMPHVHTPLLEHSAISSPVLY